MKELHNTALQRQLMDSSGYLQQFSFAAERYTRLFRAAAGEYIIREGEPSDFLYYLATGRTKLYLTLPNGKVALLDFFAAPCFLGEMELMNEDQETRAVQAIKDCYFLALPLAQCRALLLNDARFLRGICTYLSAKNYRNIILSTQNQGFPLANRLASFILLTQNGGIYREKHTQAAEYLGVSYRHLLYVLARFVKDGLLQKQGRAYRLLQRDTLQDMAREMSTEGAWFTMGGRPGENPPNV